ncbi:MAG: G5 domain-containing protein [Fimbriimonadaceae bacterium]|nr:G5 domain-containing protein [Fimbriimonadaceae bacterium]
MKRFTLGLGIAIATVTVVAQVDLPVGVRSQSEHSAQQAGTDEKANEREFFVVRKEIPFPVEYVLTRSLPHGRMKEEKPGTKGRLVDVYRIEEKDGKEVMTLVRTDRVEPMSQIFHVGKPRFEMSRGNYSRTKSIEMEASAYDPSAGRGKNATFRTATGQKAEMGVAAVDPSVIPLGTVLYIEGYGMALACDKGSAIKGYKIDLCFPTRAAALKFGRKKVKVHVLS